MFSFIFLCCFKLRIKSVFYSLIFVFICFYLLMVFGNYAITREHLHDNELPVITWWTASMSSNDRLITCYQNKYTCIIANKTQSADAFLFYGSEIDHDEFPSQRVPWAIFHEESPKNYGPFLYDSVQNLFNLSATFSRHSDFPVTLQYLENVDLLLDTQYYVPVEEKNALLNKTGTAPVLYIQSDCNTPIDRDNIVQSISNFIDIDSYGLCLRNKSFPKELSDIHNLDLYNERFLQFIARYKFIIAIENAICDDYITEKLWRPLIVGSIPIYLGSPSIQDWLPNTNSAILVENYPSIKELADVITEINNNDTLYKSFMSHKTHKQIQNEFLKEKLGQGRFGLETDQEFTITAFECFVCRKLHKNDWNEKRTESIYNCPNPRTLNWTSKENTWYQHWAVGKCQAKALQFFLESDRPYTQEQFKGKWEDYLKYNEC